MTYQRRKVGTSVGPFGADTTICGKVKLSAVVEFKEEQAMASAGKGTPSYAQATIDISVGKLQQLFNSFDPSPFHDRDLDHDAEEYIVGSAEEIGLQRPLKLIVHLPSDQLASADQATLERAIHNYFAYQQRQLQRRLRMLFHDGRIALGVGIAFLFVCILIRQLAYSLGSGTASEIIAEGMLIAGWVAMWRPLDTFLYDWWPVRRRGQIFGKLAAMPVIVRGV